MKGRFSKRLFLSSDRRISALLRTSTQSPARNVILPCFASLQSRLEHWSQSLITTITAAGARLGDVHGYQQAKRQFTNGGEVESGVFLWRLARVFARDDSGHPTQVVRKVPMGAGGRQNGRRHWPRGL